MMADRRLIETARNHTSVSMHAFMAIDVPILPVPSVACAATTLVAGIKLPRNSSPLGRRCSGPVLLPKCETFLNASLLQSLIKFEVAPRQIGTCKEVLCSQASLSLA